MALGSVNPMASASTSTKTATLLLPHHPAPPSTPGSGATTAKPPSFQCGSGLPNVDGGLNVSPEDFDEAPLLPRGTRVVVRGNARTRAVFVGKTGVIRTAVGLGGWHLLVRWVLIVFCERSSAKTGSRYGRLHSGRRERKDLFLFRGH